MNPLISWRTFGFFKCQIVNFRIFEFSNFYTLSLLLILSGGELVGVTVRGQERGSWIETKETGIPNPIWQKVPEMETATAFHSGPTVD